MNAAEDEACAPLPTMQEEDGTVGASPHDLHFAPELIARVDALEPNEQLRLGQDRILTRFQ